MQARRLPAARGVFWLFEGFRLFRRNPPLITALTLVYLLVVQVLTLLLPGVGPVVLPVVLPILTLIVANGCRLTDAGEAPTKPGLLHGLGGPQTRLPALLRLGTLQLAGAVLLVLANTAFNGGADPFASLEMAPDGSGNAAEAALLGTMLRLLLIALPLIVAFWFAPFLTGWDGISPAKSVFFSTVASWRNWRAMGMFSLAAVALAGLAPGFVLILVSQVAGVALDVAFVVLRMLLIFLVAPVLTASIYVSYRDIFHTGVDAHA